MGNFVVNKAALLIAYHYPPVKVSSGLQRTLSVSRYLPENGWQSIVLSAHPRAYPNLSSDQLADIPIDCVVKRAFALDTGRHLSIGGRYADFMALPDRWVTWWFGGVLVGLNLIRKYHPKVIWSTYPIATAHLIGLTLHKLTGLPWVADFRDSMTEADYPVDTRQRNVFKWIEKKTIFHCEKAVFTTPGAVQMYRDRYPEISERKWELIPNGFNEEIFAEVQQELLPVEDTFQERRPIILIHSGVIYPSERDPGAFFNAIGKLKKDGRINSEGLKIILRATGHDELYRPTLEKLDIGDIVELAPSVSYREALKEMMLADGLLIFQASSCNHQIPAKLYEYFRSGRPILALTDSAGNTASTIQSGGINSICPLDNPDEIYVALQKFIEEISSGCCRTVSQEFASRFSRKNNVQELANIFDLLL